MDQSSGLSEAHPRHAGYRLARRLRWLRRVRGWGRLVTSLAPPGLSAAFLVSNDDIVYEGDTSSFLDRQLYLFGQYEKELIDLFFKLIPRDRRRVLLDVGANIGTHALCFSRCFEQVHSFEPNAMVWPQFERNVALNKKTNIALHKVGLGNIGANQPFYSIDKSNFGLGTFSDIEQYDLPLRQIGTFRVENGDEYIANFVIDNIDAIKIDVQGYEPEVLAGLANTLKTFQPIVWFEYDSGTKEKMRDVSDIRQLFPYPITLWRLAHKTSLFLHSAGLESVDGEAGGVETGNFVAVPTGRELSLPRGGHFHARREPPNN